MQPEINATISGTAATLKWSATDTDTADKLSYDVYLSTTNPPTTKVVDNKPVTFFEAQVLQSTSIYYWKVVVRDDKGGETVGQIWNFKTN